jgi:hypothetical protein
MLLAEALHKCRLRDSDALGGAVPSTQAIGKKGEQTVVARCRCPNCRKPLKTLPPNYPLFDVQCTACSFRAQVKTVRSRPVATVHGAGWAVLEKVLKSGFLVPPLVVNWTWRRSGRTHREIRFYPFIPRENLRGYKLSARARHPQYRMFNYVGLHHLPCFVLYETPLGNR